MTLLTRTARQQLPLMMPTINAATVNTGQHGTHRVFPNATSLPDNEALPPLPQCPYATMAFYELHVAFS